MSTRTRLAAHAALAAAALSLTGCFTVFQHPGRQAQLGVETHDPRLDYYPYSPTVWGWYHGHYGPYWSYYAHPWWLGQHGGGGGYAGHDDDGFELPPGGSVFDRGGRDGTATGGFAHPETVAPVAGDPPRSSGTTTTTSGSSESSGSTGSTDEKPEKPKEEKPANVGGRGGRR